MKTRVASTRLKPSRYELARELADIRGVDFATLLRQLLDRELDEFIGRQSFRESIVEKAGEAVP